MAIAYDSSAQAGNDVSSFNHTCGAGSASSGLLIVVVYAFSGSLPTAVTYAGVSMTKLGGTYGGSQFAVWYLYGPTAGTNSVSITIASTQFAASSVSYLGVKQSAFPDSLGTTSSYASASGSSSQMVTTTVVGANSWLVGIGQGFLGGGSSPGVLSSNMTDRQRNNASSAISGTNNFTISDSNGTVATGSESMQFTETQAGQTCYTGYNLLLSIAVGGNSYTKSVSDAFSFSEFFSKAPVKSLIDSFTFTEAFSKVSKFFFGDTISLSESYSSLKTKGAAFLDSFSLSEVISRALSRALHDTFSISELFSAGRARVKSLTDSITLIDALTRVHTWAVSLTDSFSFSELITKAKNGIPISNVQWTARVKGAATWIARVKGSITWTSRNRP